MPKEQMEFSKLEKEPREKPSRFDYYKLMSGIIERAEELMTKKSDLPAERLANFLIYDKRNEAPPMAEQEAIIQKIAQRFADAREDVLSYAAELADKFGEKKKFDNPLDILGKNYDAKLQFLRDLGFKEPIDPAKFKIHTAHPTAIGVECADTEDYAHISAWNVEEVMMSGGFFIHKDFAHGLRELPDRSRVEKLNQNVYFLNGRWLKEKKCEKRIVLHEIQHHLFHRYFDTSPLAELRHEREELIWRVFAEPRESEKLRAKGLKSKRGELIAREAELRKEILGIPRAKNLENVARSEFSSYLKEGRYEYRKRPLFGKDNSNYIEKPITRDLDSLRARFDVLKRELWRLEAGEINPKSLYATFEARPDFESITQELARKESKITANGIENLLEHETDAELLMWLKGFTKEQKFDLKPLTPEIEEWCEKRLMSIGIKKAGGGISSSDLNLADKYILWTQSITERVSPLSKKLKQDIALSYFEDVCNKIYGMDPIAASLVKEVYYDIYTNTELKTIDDRIALAETVSTDLQAQWDEFVRLVAEMEVYNKETAALFVEEMFDCDDGHELSLLEKIKEAKEELEGLKKLKAGLE